MKFADTTIRVVEAVPELINKNHRRPVLMIRVLMPVYQHAAAAAMIRRLSGVFAPGLSSKIQMCLGKDATSSLLDQTHSNINVQRILFPS